MKRLIAATVVLSFGLMLAACQISFQGWQFRAAQKMVEKKQFKQAIDLFDRVMRRGPHHPLAIEAARAGARYASYEVKNYEKAAEFYHHIILYSPDPKERVEAQRELAAIFFEKLRNYDQALVELSHLIPLLPSKERPLYQFQVARSYFNLNNFPQALIEVDDLLTKKLSLDLRFDVLLFKGNILQAAKRLDEAIAVFKKLKSDYESRSEAENIGMSLAICYEEKNELKAAVEILEDVKKHNPNPEFVQIRINRLKERMANLPGAQGLRR